VVEPQKKCDIDVALPQERQVGESKLDLLQGTLGRDGLADITWDDLVNNRSVVGINETVARKLWPGQNPIGRHAIAGGQESEVIGVIADVRESSAEDNAGAQMYLPATKQFGPEGSYLVCVPSFLLPPWPWPH
jgi:hypothetical protein